MFLDERLKEIFDIYDKTTSEGFISAISEVLEVCRKEGVKNGRQNFVNDMKRVDSSFRLFCKNAEIPYCEEYFRRYIWSLSREDNRVPMFNLLGWEIKGMK